MSRHAGNTRRRGQRRHHGRRVKTQRRHPIRQGSPPPSRPQRVQLRRSATRPLMSFWLHGAPVHRHTYRGSGTSTAQFRTAPAGRSAFRFTSFGDLATPNTQWVLSYGQSRYAVAEVEAQQPLFHLLNGDLCYANLNPTSQPEVWRDFGNNNQASAANRPWMPRLAITSSPAPATRRSPLGRRCTFGLQQWRPDGMAAAHTGRGPRRRQHRLDHCADAPGRPQLLGDRQRL
jgi:hypothetical protein